MKNLISISIGSMLVFFSTNFALADDAEETIEEIVVTGSYLKRTAQDSPSPLSVITSADIEDLGASDISEIVQQMPWQSGSQSRASTFQGEGADGRMSINLRNLGHGATLPLVNGKRQVASWYNPRGNASVNVNGLIPNIALERIEIVKDGASALYGSDAIAGVVNFITKKDFEGMDFNYQFTTDDESGEGDAGLFDVIWGVQGDRGGMVLSASVLNRDEINVDDRYERFGGSTVSSTGQPGRIQPVSGQQIIWADHGLNPGEVAPGFPRDALGGSYGQADVDCENSAALERGGPLGTVYGNLICAYDFGSFFALQSEESLRKFHVSGHYDITDNLETYFEFAANDAEFDRLNSLNPNALNLTINEDHPGNIEDAYRRGIVPIKVVNRTRLVGGTRNTSKELRPIDTFTDLNRSDQRMVVGGVLDVDWGDREWTIDLSYTATEHDSANSQVQDTLSTEMMLAINGLGGPNCDHVNGTPGEGNLAYAASGGDFGAGSCYYFNPFGNSMFNRTGGMQDDLTLKNPAGLYQWLAGRITSDTQYRQRVLDIVASGDLFDTKSGPLAVAVGVQRRRDSGDVVLDAAANTGNLDFAFGATDWRAELTTTAFFIEAGIPIGDMLEINVAGRYEDFDEMGESSTDPKITLLFRPFDSLSARISAGSSFRVPSLQQAFGSLTTVHNMTDYGGDAAYRPSISQGNPNLKPESADNFNIGISWVPTDGALEGLSVDIDYFDYEYEDIITRESFATVLAADNAALREAITAAGGDVDSQADLIAAVNRGDGNRRQVVRNGQGLMIRILPDFINANSAEIGGIDLNASYRFDNDWGNWRVGVQAAFLNTYEVTVGGNVIDAVGKYNDTNPVARPLPEMKINGTLNWSRGNHRAFMIVKHVDEVDFGDPNANGGARFWNQTIQLAQEVEGKADFFTRWIDAFTTIDVQYTYNLGELSVFSDAEVTLGIQNLTNEDPPWIPVITGYDGTLHDPRGRIWSLRVGASL